ncbi:putative transcriptional regulatory protein [Sedimentisphaera cyanobacteriorum]|uniref:Probable transcriptional regulatory protein L21SP3_02020 n=1 Tax=Sedimentisphaera cyanobacteriorum TaxID=1940790 RepID=A0A1Q2HRY9_9BACT|nr:YebC/PmpR family DNA-binding transcriptional regulator [Sedimentisphaera cyanobacteriorum]AQQ10192.1 putative transcriptional regulatory protein [Sedimentisphaera cyanobacteriorum]
MAGHSHWAGIKHKKAANDAKRGKIWSKISRLIMVAAKNGGGDPNTNLPLRYAIDKGKQANMPKDTIEKAIKKGTGEFGAVSFEEALYEGYAPGGVAVMVDALTDNRNRTAPEIRKLFEKRGGSMGTSGCVNYMFAKKGVILISADKADEEELMDLALSSGANDMENHGDMYEINCAPEAYNDLKSAIDDAGIEVESAEVSMIPDNNVEISDPEKARKILALIESFEEHDDVQNVYSNFDIPDSVMQQIES